MPHVLSLLNLSFYCLVFFSAGFGFPWPLSYCSSSRLWAKHGGGPHKKAAIFPNWPTTFWFILLFLCFDSTLDDAIRVEKGARIAPNSAGNELSANRNIAELRSPGKMVECRICQEEDNDSNMEAPCSCCGSLKYAHRKCIQRWCNEKGDTICEICLQQFKPGYTAPLKLFHSGSSPTNFSWEISSQEINARNLIDSDYDYSDSSMRTIYCRSVAVVFIILLILRHALPLMIDETEEYSITLFSLLMLRTAGILVPVFIMVRALTTLHRRRHQQRERRRSISSSEGERQIMSSQPHLIQVQ